MDARSFEQGFLSLAVCGLVIANSAEGFFHQKKTAGPVTDDYFKKLGIEKTEKSIPAPDFTLEDLSGKRIGLKSFRGKVVFLNFWATWCIPCRQEMPAMEKLHRDFKKTGLEVVAVNFRETRKEVRKFFDELGLTFTVLLDKEGKVSEEYGAWSLPLSYFINRKGEFAGKVIGAREWDSKDSRALFKGLLDEKRNGD
jgi:peroxiredoxin